MTETPLRILHVNTEDIGGGAARIAWSLMDAQTRRGHDVAMVVGRRRSGDSRVIELPNERSRGAWARSLRHAAERCEQSQHGDTLGIPGAWRLSRALRWLAEPARRRSISRGREDFDFPGTPQLLDLTDARPDIVHLHNLHGDYFDLRWLPTLTRQVPTVITLHDGWLFSGHCAHGIQCERWATGCGSCPDLTLDPPIARDATADNWRVKRDILAASRLYFATPARELMSRFDRSIAASAAVDARVIANGIDTSIFRPGDRDAARQAIGVSHDERVLLFAARGIRRSVWKDYAMMRDAVAAVAEQVRGNVTFIALGEDGAEERIGPARVRFVPFEREAHRVAHFYQAADVYLHAARADTFPNVVLEALACGCPVVATRVGGIPEQIEHDCTGYLVAPGDAGAMAEATARLLLDDTLRHEMGRRAAEDARRRFTLDSQVDTYLSWYRDILTPKAHTASQRFALPLAA